MTRKHTATHARTQTHTHTRQVHAKLTKHTLNSTQSTRQVVKMHT